MGFIFFVSCSKDLISIFKIINNEKILLTFMLLMGLWSLLYFPKLDNEVVALRFAWDNLNLMLFYFQTPLEELKEKLNSSDSNINNLI
jgi:hypothetical protein